VLPALQLGDERVRGAGSVGDLLLGQVQLVAALANMGSDPVALAQLSDRGVLVASLPVLLAATGATPRSCAGSRPLRAYTTVGLGAQEVGMYRL
jgi:hypothetical protein